MNYDIRQSLTILQTFGLVLIGSILADKTSHELGFAISGLSVALAMASYVKARKENVVNNKTNLFFLTRTKLTHINLGLSLILGGLVTAVSRDLHQMFYGGTMVANIICNTSLMYWSEQAVAKNTLHFKELAYHPMISRSKNDIIHPITEDTILDWLTHEREMLKTAWNDTLLKEQFIEYGQIYRHFGDNNLIHDKDGHLHVGNNDVKMLTYEKNRYVWHADKESYIYFMLLVCAFEVEKAIQKTDIYALTGESPKPGEILNWMKKLSTQSQEWSPQIWWDMLVHHQGEAPAMTSYETDIYI